MNASLVKHFVPGIPVTILSRSRVAGEVRGWLSLESPASSGPSAAGVVIEGSFERVGGARTTFAGEN